MRTTLSMRWSSGFVAGAGILFGVMGPAYATPTVELNTGVQLLKESLDGKVGRETGAGVMMSSITPMGGDRLLVTWMDSDVNVLDAGWQGKVAVVQLNADKGPMIVVQPTQITNYDGERPFNHPQVASDGKYAVINFASTKDDPNNTRQYAMLVDANGKPMGNPLNIDQNDGGNHGAASATYAGMSPTGESKFILGYQRNNNESFVAGVTISPGNPPTLKQTYKTEFYRPTNIGRPECATTGTNTATCCTEVGNNRPPEYGIGCAVINTDTGDILAGGTDKANGIDGIVAASHPDKKIYMNQATISPLGNNLCAVGVVMSNGAGKNNNRGGNNTSMVYTINCQTLAVIAHTDPVTGVAPWQRHASLISTIHGNAGQTYIASLGCSSTGAGSAAIQMVPVDATGKIGTIDNHAGLLPVSWACDSATLANKGLRNPNDQGRDFIRHVGSVVNPGFQRPTGWMPEASHFLIAAIPMAKSAGGGKGGGGGGGMDGGGGGDGGGGYTSYKLQRNSLYLSFVPIAWDSKVQVVMNASVSTDQIPTGYGQCLSGCGNQSDPSNPYSPANPNSTQHSKFLGFGNGQATCSVSAPGAAGSFAGFALIGLAVAASVTRRRRSSSRTGTEG